MKDYRLKIHVYHFEDLLGSFFTKFVRNKEIIKEVNGKYNEGTWTHFEFDVLD